MGDVKFLLLSDLHEMENYDYKLMQKGLYNLLNEKEIDFVIILGDFHNYDEDNYSKAEQFIKELADKCNLDLKEDFFCVPGNHDVEDLPNLSDCVKVLKDKKFSNCSEIFQELNKRFERYNSFINQLFNREAISVPSSVQVRKWNEYNIVHLNTSLISDGFRTHKEIIDIEKLASIDLDDNLTLMIGHHRLNDIEDEICTRIKDFMRENNVSVYYHGDTHKADFDYHKIGVKRSMVEIGVYKTYADATDNYSDFGVLIETIQDGKTIKHEGYCWKPGRGFILDNSMDIDEINVKGPQNKMSDTMISNENDFQDNRGTGKIGNGVCNWIYAHLITVVTIFALLFAGVNNISKWIRENINVTESEEQDEIEDSSELVINYSESDEEKRSDDSTVSLESITDDVEEEEQKGKQEDEDSEQIDEIEELITYKWDADARLLDISEYPELSPRELLSKLDSLFWDKIIDEKNNVNLEQKMSNDYVNFVSAANTIYDKVDDTADYDDICDDILRAADCRDNAKDEYRQASNEQIEGNYYSRCATDAKTNGYVDEEFRYYQKAIEYYIDAYAVALARGNDRASALEYMATCYYRIGEMQNLDKSIRTEAYLSSICIWNEYLGKTEEKKLRTDLSIGRTYFKLCQLSEDMSVKYSYFLDAKNSFEECLDNGQCQTKTTPQVLEELRHLCQYCYDNIDKNAYEDGVTKKIIIQWRNDYDKRLKPYS